jgi:hypothetical protein
MSSCLLSKSYTEVEAKLVEERIKTLIWLLVLFTIGFVWISSWVVLSRSRDLPIINFGGIFCLV